MQHKSCMYDRALACRYKDNPDLYNTVSKKETLRVEDDMT